MKILIAIGVFFWIIGFVRVGQIVEDGLSVNKTFVRPPFFIYLICGMPKARNIPPGVMVIPSLMLQLQGLLLVICGLISLVLTTNVSIVGGVYVCGTILTIRYMLVLYKRNSYEVK